MLGALKKLKKQPQKWIGGFEKEQKKQAEDLAAREKMLAEREEALRIHLETEAKIREEQTKKEADESITGKLPGAPGGPGSPDHTDTHTDGPELSGETHEPA